MVTIQPKPILICLALAAAVSAQVLFVQASSSANSHSLNSIAAVSVAITSQPSVSSLADIALESPSVTPLPVIAPVSLPPTIPVKLLSSSSPSVTTKKISPPVARRNQAPEATHALAPVASSQGYTTSNGRLYHNGSEIVLHGANWFGMETSQHTPNGLWGRGMDSMLDQMQSLGINAVRLPLCPATIEGSGANGIDYSQNADLVNKNSLEVLDTLMTKLDARGMYSLLDLHRPNCTAQSDLWYASGYSESQWLGNISTLASRYIGNSHLVGIDLKNEPRGTATWGTGNIATDWNSAAERGGRALLGANPTILAFVEGVAENSVCSTSGNHFWGENLEPASCIPLQLPINKIVYSPHAYGPDVYPELPAFKDAQFPGNLPALWNTHFGNLKKAGATIIPGEWGGKYGTGGGLASDVAWQNTFSSYLIQNGICSSFYWSWNPNSGDTGGILQDDWKTVWPSKVSLLQHYWGRCH